MPPGKNRTTAADAGNGQEKDKLIYQLYGLTEEEIKIVEGEALGLSRYRYISKRM
ncbi:MAG: hypothetical protein R6W90_10280 [Ignavibacteriaceae bacterium]